MTYQASIVALIDQPPLLPKIELSLEYYLGNSNVVKKRRCILWS